MSNIDKEFKSGFAHGVAVVLAMLVIFASGQRLARNTPAPPEPKPVCVWAYSTGQVVETHLSWDRLLRFDDGSVGQLVGRFGAVPGDSVLVLPVGRGKYERVTDRSECKP